MSERKRAKARARRWGMLCLWLAVLSALAAALSGFGHRLGLWDFSLGFSILRWAAYVGLAAAAASACVWLYAAFRRAWIGLVLAGLALVIAVASVGMPWRYLQQARAVPPINDITTDTESPPEFVDIRPLRAGAGAPSEYRGVSLAARQREAYPELASLAYPLPPDRAFERAVAVARELGWTIVAAAPAQGRIEATDQTFWFGFTDDVVIRIGPDPAGSLIDLRSASRKGVSDLGVNAARIRAFIDKLTESAGAQ